MNDTVVLKNHETLTCEVVTTDIILQWPSTRQKALRTELEHIFFTGFPIAPEEEWKDYVCDFYRLPGGGFRRHAVLLRNMSGCLVATMMFDYGDIVFYEKRLKGMYAFYYLILPEYQRQGLASLLPVQTIHAWEPDIWFANVYQSSALHSLVNHRTRSLLEEFDVYPRLEHRNGQDVVLTIPYKDLDLAIRAFEQMYRGYVQGDPDRLYEAIRELSVFFVRKNTHTQVYDYHPWQKNGREDILANKLGLTANDGMMVMMKKRET